MTELDEAVDDGNGDDEAGDNEPPWLGVNNGPNWDDMEDWQKVENVMPGGGVKREPGVGVKKTSVGDPRRCCLTGGLCASGRFRI